MKKLKYIIIIIGLLTIFSQVCLAATTKISVTADIEDQLKQAGSGTGPYDTGTAEKTMASIVGIGIKAFLSILGLIFIILVLTGGYNYMNARGDEERVEKALTTIRRAIIGLIITVGSYAIWEFVFVRLIVGSSG